MSVGSTGKVRVIDSAGECPELPIVVGPGSAKAVIWPGNGAKWRSFNIVDLECGSRTVDLQHPSDCVYYVDRGAGIISDLSNGETVVLEEGTMLHIDKGDRYRIEATAGDGLLLIGGPCPADQSLYADIKEVV